MAVVQSSLRKVPVPKVPRSWRKERIAPTHVIYNGDIQDKNGKRMVREDIPAFGCGWRPVHLESEGRKWAHVIECGTGAKAKVELETWQKLVRRGRVLDV